MKMAMQMNTFQYLPGDAASEQLFCSGFDREPFGFAHQLHRSPSFSYDALLDLTERVSLKPKRPRRSLITVSSIVEPPQRLHSIAMSRLRLSFSTADIKQKFEQIKNNNSCLAAAGSCATVQKVGVDSWTAPAASCQFADAPNSPIRPPHAKTGTRFLTSSARCPCSPPRFRTASN